MLVAIILQLLQHRLSLDKMMCSNVQYVILCLRKYINRRYDIKQCLFAENSGFLKHTVPQINI